LTKLIVGYQPTFVRKLKKLPVVVIGEALEKIVQFHNPANHEQLRVHNKLKGQLKNKYSFSVTYSHRIIFEYIEDNSVMLITIGDHSEYEKYS